MRTLYQILTLLFVFLSSSSFSQSITVGGPNGGESWEIGDGQYIYWSSTSVTDVKLEYTTDGGNSWNVINASVPAANQYYYWVIPNTPSTDCFVRVSDVTNASVNDWSDFSFTILPAFIEIYSPYGGEIWGIGSSQYISWNAPGVTNVKIDYSTDNGSTWKPVIASTQASVGYYYWTIPNDTSSQCLIKIEDASNAALYDISSYTFTIPPKSVVLLDPNGGENWGSSTNQYITWNSYSFQDVKIEYSTDSGATWNTIVASMTASTQYYYWTIPNTPSTRCLVRVSDVSDPSVNAVSADVFTITGPSITVTAPNGFEIWNAGTNHWISWNANGISAFRIEYTADNGVTWNLIEANHPSSSGNYYYWLVPNDYSSQCRVKISDAANTSNYDISNDLFTIPSPMIDVDQPNGGEVYGAGSSYYIYWTSTSISKVDLHYSADNGINWILIADSVTASNGYYYWTVPNTYSNSCLMKVSETGNAAMYDVSDATFTIPVPTITVTSPNGGESWGAFSGRYIYWTAPSVANVKIEYSADNGSSWNLIVASTPAGTGYYYWSSVPLTPSANCLVRVTDLASNLVYDVSDAVFTIPMPSISLYNPNGGEIWSAGSQQYVGWNSVSVSDVKIEYSTNNGTSWNVVTAAHNASNGYYYWTVPNTPSTTCLVKITDNLNSGVGDTSAATFTIPQPAIAVTVPNGGEQWSGGSQRYIQWTSPSVQNVRIEYTTDNGSNWNVIASSVPGSDGSYAWTLPMTPSGNCKVKISDASNTSLFDLSDSLFVIPQPTITVLSPNGGEVWSVNQPQSVTWTSATVSNVKVEYTLNNGASWNTAATNVPAANGYYYWYLPSTASNDCKVKVTSLTSASVFDMSDSLFKIAGPSITLTSPVGGESWDAGSQYYITWNSNGINNVRIEYTTDNEATWNVINANTTNYGYYYWTVPTGINSTTCKVKVTSVLASSVTAKSPSVFSIQQPTASIALSAPNGGENFYVGSSYYISWTTNAIANVKIEYSINGGTSWLPVSLSFQASNGFYYWNIPATPSQNCKVKISDVLNPAMFDISDAEFSISVAVPSLTVTSPNGGEIWYTNSYRNITWNVNNVPAVDLFVSIDNGATWTTLATNLTQNYYYWYVPNTPSIDCKVKVSSAGPAPIVDLSDSNFVIATPPPNTNAITTDSISPAAFCKLDTIKVYYTASGVYNSGNTFTAQISDSTGSFTYPKVIGSVAGTTSGYVTAVVPAYIANGNQFRIRVVSDDLPATGSDKGPYTLDSPQFNFTANDVNKYLPDGLVNFTYSGVTAASYLWSFGDGTTSTITSPSHTYSQIGYKTVSLTTTNVNGCALTITKPFYIRVERLLPSVNINTMTSSDITGIAFKNDTTGCIATADGACRVTANGGTTWASYPTGLTTLTSATWISGNGIYVTAPNGGIAKSTNNGQSWSVMTTNTTETINSAAFHPVGGKGYAVGTNGKLLVNAGSSSWTPVTSGVTKNLVSVNSYGTGKATVVGDDGTILRTTNYGATWNTISAPTVMDLKHVIFADTLTGYVAAENGVLLSSTDGGASWNVSLTGVDVNFTSVAVTKTGDTAWATSNSGVIYKTTNRGQTWSRFSKGSTNDNTGSTYKSSRGYITGKGGDLKMFGGDTASSAITVKELSIIENSLSVYPNPARDQFVLKFNTKTGESITWSLYDVNGRMILKPATESSSGVYTKTVSTSQLSPGVYFLSIESSVESIVTRVVVVK